MADMIIVAIQILSLLFGRTLGPETTGTASQYAPGRMAEVVANRQRMGHLPADLSLVHGYIAVKDCGQIGRLWLIQPEGGSPELFLVADCAKAGDGTVFWMITNGIILEVDHGTAERWNTVGRGIAVIAREILP